MLPSPGKLHKQSRSECSMTLLFIHPVISREPYRNPEHDQTRRCSTIGVFRIGGDPKKPKHVDYNNGVVEIQTSGYCLYDSSYLVLNPFVQRPVVQNIVRTSNATPFKPAA